MTMNVSSQKSVTSPDSTNTFLFESSNVAQGFSEFAAAETNDADSVELNNKIHLLFSRDTTDKNDRLKIENFWRHFDNDEVVQKYFQDKPKSAEEKESSERSSQEYSDPKLYGTITYSNLGGNKSTALQILAMLKSKHLDQVALATAPVAVKPEGSPLLADEIIEENIDTVNEHIKTFEDLVSQRTDIKKQNCYDPHTDPKALRRN